MVHEIANHLYGDITLERLAECTNLSPNYLSSLFKKEVELTISDYVQRERIEEAKRLLTLTDYPITDIAAWLNFNDQSYFNKVFKKWNGSYYQQDILTLLHSVYRRVLMCRLTKQPDQQSPTFYPQGL